MKKEMKGDYRHAGKEKTAPAKAKTATKKAKRYGK
jgi:hypothetical protein